MGSYPPETRELLSAYGPDAMLIQTGNGSIIVNFSTENYYSILDSTGKSDDVIIRLFDLFFQKLDMEKNAGSYTLSVYTSGEDKWIKICFESQDYCKYAIVRNNTGVILTFSSELTPEETEPIIDSFQF